MSFDYDQLKQKEESSENHWASYSDLFMVLSLVFLLLYVTASLRSGTFGIQKQQAYKELVKQNEDFKQQLKVYNTLKEDYLAKGASQDELETYSQLMDKLSLLKDEAKQEKDQLRKAAKETELKEMALNKYQQAVRNIINSNMLSQARIKKRDGVIAEDQQKITGLEQTITQKETELSKRQKEIAQKNSELKKKMAQLQSSFKQQKISKEKFEKSLAQLKTSNAQEVKKLEQKNQQIASEIQKYNQELEKTNAELEMAQQQIEQKEQSLQVKEKAISELLSEKSQVTAQIESMKNEHSKRVMEQRKQFEEQLQKEKLTAEARLAKQAEFREKLAQRQKELDSKVSELSSKVLDSQDQLNKALLAKNQAEAEKQRFAASVDTLKQEKGTLSSDLKKAQALLDEKKNLIKRIKSNFEKAGIKADVDEKTGDVVINFGEEYFDADKANLKPEMERILRQFMPTYTKSLLNDKKTASRVSNVEIIGFASPTYKGKYVDPVSLKAADRDAANYNLDLSYYRARAIYDHIFDKQKMTYDFQQDLLPLVKVTGRSFFAEGSEKDLAAGISASEYCKKYDCKKAQKVIIRFDLRDK